LLAQQTKESARRDSYTTNGGNYMIIITEQHVHNFEKWKTSLQTQIKLMQDAVKEAEPKKYKNNPFYIKLMESEDKLEIMKISPEKITYKEKEVSTIFEFGRYLSEYWNQIKVTSEPNHIAVAMMNAKEDLFGIFEDIAKQ